MLRGWYALVVVAGDDILVVVSAVRSWQSAREVQMRSFWLYYTRQHHLYHQQWYFATHRSLCHTYCRYICNIVAGVEGPEVRCGLCDGRASHIAEDQPWWR